MVEPAPGRPGTRASAAARSSGAGGRRPGARRVRHGSAGPRRTRGARYSSWTCSKRENRPGSAANPAANVIALGSHATVISVVTGCDQLVARLGSRFAAPWSGRPRPGALARRRDADQDTRSWPQGLYRCRARPTMSFATRQHPASCPSSLGGGRLRRAVDQLASDALMRFCCLTTAAEWSAKP